MMFSGAASACCARRAIMPGDPFPEEEHVRLGFIYKEDL